MEQKVPKQIQKEKIKSCVIGLIADPERLVLTLDVIELLSWMITDLQITSILTQSKKRSKTQRTFFKKYNWPIIDVTRKSVEETAASIIKIIEIKKNK